MTRNGGFTAPSLLARRADLERFRKIEVYSARNVLHTFRLHTPTDVDEELSSLLTEAYEVGAQHHLRHP